MTAAIAGLNGGREARGWVETVPRRWCLLFKPKGDNVGVFGKYHCIDGQQEPLEPNNAGFYQPCWPGLGGRGADLFPAVGRARFVSRECYSWQVDRPRVGTGRTSWVTGFRR